VQKGGIGRRASVCSDAAQLTQSGKAARCCPLHASLHRFFDDYSLEIVIFSLDIVARRFLALPSYTVIYNYVYLSGTQENPQ